MPVGAARGRTQVLPVGRVLQRPRARRVIVLRSGVEVHRYFLGWENFWFSFKSPLNGMCLANSPQPPPAASATAPAQQSLAAASSEPSRASLNSVPPTKLTTWPKLAA